MIKPDIESDMVDTDTIECDTESNTNTSMSKSIDAIDRRVKNIPIEKLVELRSKGLSYQQIASIVKCSKANVGSRLQDYDDYSTYKKDVPEYLEHLSWRIGKSISDKDIQKASFAQKVVALGIVRDKIRDIKGKFSNTTSNFFTIVLQNSDKKTIDIKTQAITSPETT